MELKEALEKISELEGKVTTLSKENEDFKAGALEVANQMKAKDAEIEDMKLKAKERGEQFKKFRDMTAEEKELLTEKEKELLQRQEAQEEALKKFQNEQSEFTKKQKDALIDNLAMKKAGGNKELADKIKVTLSKIKDIDSKATEAELGPEIDFAFNGLGIQTTPNPLSEAHNAGGSTGEYQTDGSFAETSEGKSLAGALGLSQAQPEANK
jgi:hypothetical protein